jgi:hypothetical protein
MTDSVDIHEAFADGRLIDDAMCRAAQAARGEYIRAGLSMPVWRDGQVVWIEPAELQRYAADAAIARARSHLRAD